MKVLKRFTTDASGKTVAAFALLLIATRLMLPVSGPGVTAFLSWETFGHYLYLPALFIHDDPALFSFGWIDQMLRHYQPLIGYETAVIPAAQGGMSYVFSPGIAILLSPFFLAGHFAALACGFPADGLSLPYQAAMAAGGLVTSIAALALLRRVLLRWLPDQAAAAALAIIVLISGWLPQVILHGAEPVNLLVTLYLLLILLIDGLIHRPGTGFAAGAGITAGFILLVRPTDMLLLAPILAWALFRPGRRHLHLSLFTLLFFLATAGLQILFALVFYGPGRACPLPAWPHAPKDFIPLFVLALLPATLLLKRLPLQKPGLRYPVLASCVLLTLLQAGYAGREYVTEQRAARGPGAFFCRYDRAEKLPQELRYTTRTWTDNPTELLDHAEWFDTARVFAMTPQPAALNTVGRFSPGINAPLATFVTPATAGLKATALLAWEGPPGENTGMLVMTLLRDRKPVGWQGAPFQGAGTEKGEWKEISLAWMVGDVRPGDTLQAYVWYTGSRTARVGSFFVTRYDNPACTNAKQ